MSADCWNFAPNSHGNTGGMSTYSNPKGTMPMRNDLTTDFLTVW